MQTVAVLGVGLIGGSFALALKRAGFTGRVIGVSSPRTVEAALKLGVIDEALPLEQALPQADLVYLAQPITRILQTIGLLDPLLKPGALVSDAGSTKAMIVDVARRAIRRGQFLGGHPMAGKETRGVEEAEAGLFEGRTYVLTPSDPVELETPAAAEFVEWVRRIGAVPVVFSPEEHDRIVANTSHLPQLASTALAATLSTRLDGENDLAAAGPGLADMTRLALSSYDIWRDILVTNPAEIDAALAAYIVRLESIRAALLADPVAQDFNAASEFAIKLRNLSRK
jgi:prephenate dehydrogenase